MRRAAAVAAAILALVATGAAQSAEQATLSPRPGISEAVLFMPAARPRENVVIFVGGNGVLAMTQKNFLMRISPQLVAAGFNVVAVDAPSDHRGGMDGNFRASAEHAQDIAAAVAFLKGKADLPVWLVGTSMGSVSAANGAVRLGPQKVAGVVLTSSVWSGGMNLVPFRDIAVPVLVVHNRDDHCPSAPFAGAEQAVAQMARAPAKDFLPVSGGVSKSAVCEAQAPHGYFEVEDKVVPPVVAWIDAHSPPH